MDDARWEVAEENGQLTRNLMEAVGASRPLALALSNLGIGPEQASSFLRPSLRELTDPYRLPGVQAAAARLWRAVVEGEGVLIHGDYDTDGITAAVLLRWVLRKNGGRADCFLPHRMDDGYGLTPESIRKACTEHHSVLVTVDCGITSYEAVTSATRSGLDVIVTDHHEPGAQALDALAVIDPKLPGADADVHGLAGVGVAFKLCHGFLKYGRENGLGGHDTDLREGLDLVALGTVADIVPLLGENRRLVRHGLAVLSRQQRPGVRALCEITGTGDTIRASDVAFRLAPRLNAAGRLGDPSESMVLLQAGSMVEAMPLAESLDGHNRIRQQLEEEVLSAAESQIREWLDLGRDHTIVAWGDSWHQGVIGIVASRLARRYNRPSVVLTAEAGGHLCGSGRSIRRINLVSVLEKCSPLLTRFGGHPMAAGLTLPRLNLDRFRTEFEDAVRQLLGAEAMKPQLDILGQVNFSEVGEEELMELEMLEPFGHSNPEPVFLARGVWPERVLPAGSSHSRGAMTDSSGYRLDFIAFGRSPGAFPPSPWDIAYTPQINRYRGRSTPQARVVGLRSSEE